MWENRMSWKWNLTLDEDPEADYEGIRRINALDWLIGTTQ